MQELPCHAPTQSTRPTAYVSSHPALPTGTIDGIADDRMPDVGQMDPYLVRSSRLESNLQELRTRPTLETAEMSDRMPPAFRDRHPLPVGWIATHRRIHLDRGPGEMPPRGRLVQASDLTPPEPFGKSTMRSVGLGNHHQSGCVFVQTVHDAGSQPSADAGQIGGVGEQGVDQRARTVAGARVNHHSCRLVHHKQPLVFEQDIERYLLGHDREGLGWRDSHFDLLPGLQALGLPGWTSVEEDSPLFE